MTVGRVLLPSVALLLSGSFACSRPQARASDAAPPVAVEDAPDPYVITIAHPEQFPLVDVTLREVHPELQLPGVVAPDISRSVPVTSLAGGRVGDVRVRLGDTVTKGQVLLTLRSPDVTQAQADLKKCVADAELARKTLDRARLLSEHEALAARDLEAAVNADAKAQADLRAAEERLQLLGGTASAPAIVELRAPAAGVVVEQNVTSGAAVKSLDNSPNLFTIADLSRVWVLCDVYENNLGEVHAGDTAAVRLHAFPNRALQARVNNIARLLDPATRTAKVRLELSNPDGVLRPGMFATVTFTAQERQTRAVVPATAVLRLHDKDWVFVPLGDHRFRRTEIRTGRVDQSLQEVLSGLRPGDRVVANALQMSSASEQ